MTKTNLDRVLENAVATALGFAPPHKTANRLIVPTRRPQSIKHAA